MTIALIAGARPNFIKAVPLYRALMAQPGMRVECIHTGQHPDAHMSSSLATELGLRVPWITLEGQEHSPVRETARILRQLEPVLEQIAPDWVIVIGDVRSTLAAALAARQLGLRLAHVEAGLRSGDRAMPEEINRIVVDHLSDLLFASEEAGRDNLLREGIDPGRILLSGNVLIDALHLILPSAKQKSIPELLAGALLRPLEKPLESARFALCTLHRPSNVDTADGLQRVMDVLPEMCRRLPVLFPLHPRTEVQLRRHGYFEALGRIHGLVLTRALRYEAMIGLLRQSAFVLTDSGGVQEESTALGIPCLSFRSTTERPATLVYGTNTLIAGRNTGAVLEQMELILSGKYRSGQVPPFWDGHAAERIAAVLTQTKNSI